LLYCGECETQLTSPGTWWSCPAPEIQHLKSQGDNTSYDKNNGSSMLGRNRLFDAFLDYELWTEDDAVGDYLCLERVTENRPDPFMRWHWGHLCHGDQTNEGRRPDAELKAAAS